MELLYKQKNLWETMTEAEKTEVMNYGEVYKDYLDRGKTERLCVDYTIALAEEKGFRAYTPGDDIKSGDKIYVNNRGMALFLAVIGTESFAKGVNIGAAHIDSPRLDLKPLPLYEDGEMAFLKTHYFGGVKKYQWVATPLALHGVVIRKDGETVKISIGERLDDPCFTITDLLPHLGKDQAKKPLGESFEGEGLNILFGGVPCAGEEKERVKLGVLKLLHERYGIIEEDFLSAELSLVPAFPARDVGLDRSFIGAYGQDDRACSFAGLKALFDIETPKKTAVMILADKEETGSEGATGMKSQAFEWFMEGLCDSQNVKMSTCFANSFCLSMDVCNGFDPNYPEVSEKRNNAKMNYGLGVMKYTGSRGKGGTSDAPAEVVGKLRKVLDQAGVTWQMTELGKVDQGGGGTVAMFMSGRNIDTIDAGMPLLSMHAPFEIAAKVDCYMTYKAARAVFELMQ